jgi:hypothetical protein
MHNKSHASNNADAAITVNSMTSAMQLSLSALRVIA